VQAAETTLVQRLGWLSRPVFTVPALARNDVRLFLTSSTLLFVELLLIRWIPANVTYIGFFTNFVLMASFLGIGIGILLGRHGVRLPASPFAVLLAAVVFLVYVAQLNVQLRSTDELFFGLNSNRSADVNFLVLPLIVVLVTTLMASLALPLGPLFRSMPPLRAYAIDIAGSMAGIAAFTLLSARGTNPVLWFVVVAALLVLLALGSGVTPLSLVSGAAMTAILIAAFISSRSGDIWSPYYRITVTRSSISVNGIPHQSFRSSASLGEQFYGQVYKWFPQRQFGDVLVIGAGSGNDVAFALANGATHVDAVEIDPQIQRIGAQRHPDRPYRDPRVSTYINDGRAFLRNTDKQYDLVIFALTDSLTLVSTTANLRLESFLFTEQAFASARDHLKSDGVFVLYNYYREPWLVTKLGEMLQETFGSAPILRSYGGAAAVLADGPAVAALNGGPPPGDAVDAVPQVGAPDPRPATDDWPFLYLRQPFIAPYYLVTLAFLLLGAVLAVAGAARLTGTPLRRFSPHFFVMGVAFLLLETRSLVSFSLLFGTTWIVNALAFFAILASVLLAIFVNARFPIRRPTVLYAGLFVALLVAFLLPPESLLIEPAWLRYALAAALAFAPVFFANLVFSYSFRDTRTADMAFASNLLGAMVGGALEYLALLTGYRALLIVVAVLYALAYVFATRWRRLADVELAREDTRLEAPATPEPAL
jgi:SAM-dependent methyltransferase